MLALQWSIVRCAGLLAVQWHVGSIEALWLHRGIMAVQTEACWLYRGMLVLQRQVAELYVVSKLAASLQCLRQGQQSASAAAAAAP